MTTKEISVDIQRLPGAEDLPMPAYESQYASGMDLRAAVTEPITLKPGERKAIPTGICVAIPPGYEGQVRPRSGLAIQYGITMINAPGTIDADYRGEIRILIINHGDSDFVIHRGDRIAQFVITPVVKVSWKLVEHLETTDRGAGGFGHTGR